MVGGARLGVLCLSLAAGLALARAGHADGAADPAASAAAIPDWRPVAAENLLIITVPTGDILVELNPAYAPGHVLRMQDMARARAYDGASFYRVITQFVAQGGLDPEERDIPDWPNLPIEAERQIDPAMEFTPLGSPDPFAEEAGHAGGFAVGRAPSEGKTWALHCPGAMAMARNDDPDTGGTEFYIVNGSPQRYLDRNLTVFGRVIDGMEHVDKLNVGDRAINSGVIGDPAARSPILAFRLASELAEAERPMMEVMRTDSAAFDALKTARRVRAEPFFFFRPPEVLPACAVQAPARRTAPREAR